MFDLEELELLLESVNVKCSEVEYAIGHNENSDMTGYRINKLKKLRELRKKIISQIKELKK